jgi:TolB-like protein
MNKAAAFIERLKRLKGPIAAIAAGGAILSGMVGYYTTYKTVASVSPASLVSAAPTPAPGAMSIMVLPFANQTGDANQAYVADALTDSITSDLSRIPDALVVPSATARAYKDKPAPLQQLARELGVRYVLHGNVQRTGGTVRINATLADARTDRQLWSQAFDGQMTDLFALQEQITARLGNTINHQLVLAAAREADTRKEAPKVADLILRARALRMQPESFEMYAAAERLYRQVLKIEPNHQQAMIRLAQVLAARVMNLSDRSDPAADEKSWEEARALALKVKALDANEDRAYDVLADYAASHDDFPTATAYRKKVVELAPKSAYGYNMMGYDYLYAGEPEKALPFFEKFNDLSAVRDGAWYLGNTGIAYFMLGQDSKAIQLFIRATQAGPPLPYLSMAYARTGDAENARKARDAYVKYFPKATLSNDGNKPSKSQAEAYKNWYASQFVPAWRKAGLPE